MLLGDCHHSSRAKRDAVHKRHSLICRGEATTDGANKREILQLNPEEA